MGSFIIKQLERGDGREAFGFFLFGTNRLVLASSRAYHDFSACRRGARGVVKAAILAEIEDRTTPDFEPIRAPKFEISLDHESHYLFRLVDPSGDYVLVSERYATKAAALAGIETVKKSVAVPRFFVADGDKWAELLGGEPGEESGGRMSDDLDIELQTDRPLYSAEEDEAVLQEEQEPIVDGEKTESLLEKIKLLVMRFLHPER